MFRRKSISRNHCTPCRVFGCTWKIWSNGKSFPLTVKCGWLKCKIDYRSILPSNYFKKKKHQTEKEREAGHRHGERKSKTKPPTIKERKAGHLNLESTSPPSRLCLSPSIYPVSLFLPLLPFATHVTNLPFFSLPMLSKPPQDEQPTMT